MRKFLLVALAVATALPTITVAAPAAAQSRHEVRRDRHEVRQERRDVRRARRHGDHRQIRRERRDVRHARRELRQDRRDHRQARRWSRNDWRNYRHDNRRVFRRGGWHAPFRYHAFRTGIRIAPSYYSSRYYIADPYAYHLPAPGYYQRWVRHYDDVLLVDVRTGMVLDVIRNFYW